MFLAEARADLLQGIAVPLERAKRDRKDDGSKAFSRHACKMATGSGKTTVMGMLTAWNILNKVGNRSDARFSRSLVVCPNVTIRRAARGTRSRCGGKQGLPHTRPCALRISCRNSARGACSSRTGTCSNHKTRTTGGP